MHGGTFNNPKKATWQMFHGYEQEIGDIWGLLAQHDLPYILPNHWCWCLKDDRVRPYSIFQTLKFEIVNGCFSTGGFFISPARLRNLSATKTKLNFTLC